LTNCSVKGSLVVGEGIGILHLDPFIGAGNIRYGILSKPPTPSKLTALHEKLGILTFESVK